MIGGPLVPTRTGLLIVGAGRIGRTHAQAVLEDGAAELVGFVDPDEVLVDQVALDHGVSFATTKLEEGLAHPDVDAVIVCAPTAMHEEIASMAMNYGKHVLVEKPFTTDLASAQRLISRAERIGVHLGAAQILRFLPMFEWAREYIAEGELGRPIQFIERRLVYRRENPVWWSDLPCFLVAHWGSHSVDLLTHLFETTPTSAYGEGASISPDYGVIDDFNLHMSFDCSLRAGFHMTFTSRVKHHDMILIGERHTMEFDCYREVRVDGKRVFRLEESDMLSRGFANQLADFMDSISGRHASRSSGVSILDGLAGIDAAQQSMQTGNLVKI